jgi:DNA end-binding protein Ku
MAPRAVWKGHLRLSLVSIEVEMFAARAPGANASFRQVHAPSGNPVRHLKPVPGIGPVTGAGACLLLGPDESDAIRLETRNTLDRVQVVGASDLLPLSFDRPCHVVPTDEPAGEACRVQHDALRRSDTTGPGQLTRRGKECLAARRPRGDGLLLETRHSPDALRDAEFLDLGTSPVARKTAPFDAAACDDHYAEGLRELIDAGRGSGKAGRVEVGEGETLHGCENVVDLMAALERSLGGNETEGGSGKSRKAPGDMESGGLRSASRRKKAS